MRQGRTLHNDQRIDPKRRYSNCKYICTQHYICTQLSFPDSSVGKKSACNEEDPSSIPGPGGSTAEGIGYPLHYSWASLVVQLEKNPPAMQETWVCSLGWEDPLEKGKATHFSILAWKMGSQRVRYD